MTEALLRLYIAGNSASSRRAEQDLVQLRNHIDSEEWTIEVVDVIANPEMADRAGILATPTLCYDNVTRPRRIVGDLSDVKRVLAFLGIEPKGMLP